MRILRDLRRPVASVSRKQRKSQAAWSFPHQHTLTSIPTLAAGEFTDAPGQSQCAQCGTGKYLTDAGTTAAAHTTEALCLDCPAGTFADTPGTAECSTCPPGEVPNANADGCTICDSGAERPNADQTACEPCPEGTFGSATVSGTCDVCSGLSQSVSGGAQ